MCNDDQRSREQLAKQLNLSCLPVDGEDLVPLVSELFRCYRQNVSNCVNGSLFGLTSQSADNNVRNFIFICTVKIFWGIILHTTFVFGMLFCAFLCCRLLNMCRSTTSTLPISYKMLVV